MDISTRFKENPLLSPADLPPSAPNLQVRCLLNPGVFLFQDKVHLLVRVAEGVQFAGEKLFIPIRMENGIMQVLTFDRNDPELRENDVRVINYKGLDYLTTLSYLKLFSSNDGIIFKPETLSLHGTGRYEQFGIEDCRVSLLNDTYYLSYTAVSDNGVTVALKTTKNWQHFEERGLIFPPHNKDVAIFETRIDGKFYALHRPSSKEIGGHYIWLAESPDGYYWGQHQCLLKSRPGYWDAARVGAGAAPIKTEQGWLLIYHGADYQHRYCLGAALLALDAPWRVLARTEEPIMEPTATYELNGFFGSVIFSNGHVVRGDQLTIYYGAADEVICGANFSITQIMAQLTFL